jgi:hypothetical protein
MIQENALLVLVSKGPGPSGFEVYYRSSVDNRVFLPADEPNMYLADALNPANSL